MPKYIKYLKQLLNKAISAVSNETINIRASFGGTKFVSHFNCKDSTAKKVQNSIVNEAICTAYWRTITEHNNIRGLSTRI